MTNRCVECNKLLSDKNRIYCRSCETKVKQRIKNREKFKKK